MRHPDPNIHLALTTCLAWLADHPGDYKGAANVASVEVPSGSRIELLRCIDAMQDNVPCPRCEETYGWRGDECIACNYQACDPAQHTFGLYDVDRGEWCGQWWETRTDAQAWIDVQPDDWTDDGKKAIFKTDSYDDFFQSRSDGTMPWNDRATDTIAHALVGRTIIAVRVTTRMEMDAMYWQQPGPVLVLDDGTRLIPGLDEDGNAPGAILVYQSNRWTGSITGEQDYTKEQ